MNVHGIEHAESTGIIFDSINKTIQADCSEPSSYPISRGIYLPLVANDRNKTDCAKI